MTKQGYFEVDKEGLADIVRRRHPGFIFGELVANAFDQKGTTHVTVGHEPVPGRPLIKVWVTDNDPTGFEDLSDAYTLFRRTKKRADATVRGRFNMGEKEFLSICLEAQIKTTIGSVFFTPEGTRRVSTSDKDKTAKGTEVIATVKMTREDYDLAVEFLEMIIPPEGIKITGDCMEIVGPRTKTPGGINDWYIVGDFEATLPTEIEDDEGELRRTARKTRVIVSNIPKHREGGPAWLYEMGIPVCELPDDTWDINVMQKVPLARDRDSVTPGYLQKLRVGVLNSCHDDLEEDDATQAWVTEAIGDKDVEKDAFNSVVETRFGEDAVIYDPSDKEANDRALADGRKIIYGGSIPGGAHTNLKRFGEVPAAGTAFPTSKVIMGPGGDNVDINMTDAMEALCAYTVFLGQELMGVNLKVKVVNSKQGFSACYGDRVLLFNVRCLGRAWFNSWPKRFLAVHDLIIHEFGHEYEESHLSERYHEALSLLGAKLGRLVLLKPEEVKAHLGEEVLA